MKPSKKIKILTVIGARPQFVKAAVVSRILSQKEHCEEVLVHTGQHFDANMSDVFFEEMNIPTPKYNLEIGGMSHGAMTGRMLEEVEKVLVTERPDAVLIYGDTNSTLAGALAAVKMHIPVAHVEAGLRSFNRRMPEEINRILADQISTWLFCPTETAIQNLKTEGVASSRMSNVGDVMYDAALFYKGMGKVSSEIQALISRSPQFSLVTLHRAENTDDPERMDQILHALKAIGKGEQGISPKQTLIWPVHPRTKKKLESMGLKDSGIVMIDPVGYFDMLALLASSFCVLTDSGGVQKEAYFFAKPCITLRDETEWVELVKVGANEVVGADSGKIMNSFKARLSASTSGAKSSDGKEFQEGLYGDGHAGEKIVSRILKDLGAKDL